MGGAEDPIVMLEREVAAMRVRLQASEAQVARMETELVQADHDLELLEEDVREHLPAYQVGEGDDTEDANAREVIEYAGAEIARLTSELEQCKRELARMTQHRNALAKTIDEWPPMRPVLRAFAGRMERELVANDHKGGWHRDTQDALFERLMEEASELCGALQAVRLSPVDLAVRAQVIKEAADVANFAMMIADNAGGGARD